jgi:hypothetical protein
MAAIPPVGGTAYAPSGAMVRQIDLGTWTAAGAADLHLVSTLSERLLSWYVQVAAQSPGGTFCNQLGDLAAVNCVEVVA